MSNSNNSKQPDINELSEWQVLWQCLQWFISCVWQKLQRELKESMSLTLDKVQDWLKQQESWSPQPRQVVGFAIVLLLYLFAFIALSRSARKKKTKES